MSSPKSISNLKREHYACEDVMPAQLPDKLREVIRDEMNHYANYNLPMENKRCASHPQLAVLKEEAEKVIGAPQWLKDRKAALAKRPPPTVERVRAQWKASAEHALLLGTFAPTTHWNDDERVLYITLETKQMVAVLHHAPIPSDESKEANWGRRILEEIHRMYLEHIKKHGACEIRLIHRRYDGEIV